MHAPVIQVRQSVVFIRQVIEVTSKVDARRPRFFIEWHIYSSFSAYRRLKCGFLFSKLTVITGIRNQVESGSKAYVWSYPTCFCELIFSLDQYWCGLN